MNSKYKIPFAIIALLLVISPYLIYTFQSSIIAPLCVTVAIFMVYFILVHIHIPSTSPLKLLTHIKLNGSSKLSVFIFDSINILWLIIVLYNYLIVPSNYFLYTFYVILYYGIAAVMLPLLYLYELRYHKQYSFLKAWSDKPISLLYRIMSLSFILISFSEYFEW